MAKTKTLGNGLRVIVKRMEGLLSVTMGVLVGTGSAYETDAEDGISHFLEHMEFKGTPSRTAFEISDAFDALGAQVNAFTGKDMTCYYAKATSDHAGTAFALLADLFLNSNFPEKEVKREKGVVLEEISMDEDTPEDLCLDLVARTAFGKSGYGRNILGPAKNVRKFTRDDLFRYRGECYCPENCVISFAGNISYEEAFALAEKYFGDWKSEPFGKREKVVTWKSGRSFRDKPIEQAHLAIGFPSVERGSDLCPALQVMNTILGGGMSSRLFKRVREELGLAYSVYSYFSHYEETGIFTVYAGVNAQKAEAAKDAIVSVIEEFKKQGVTEEEFLRGREQAKSSIIFSQENTSSQMLIYGKQMLYKNEVYDFEKRMSEFSSLTRENIGEAIAASFDFSKAVTASVGNVKKAITL
ncbi:MAG: insulinase family protein [Clostridia bacterium]|nr:insulinase family protein [Clostridia bacterium]